MNQIKKLYTENINGIIFTLLFHIIVFITLNISQLNIRKEFVETEILIDFPLEDTTEKPQNSNADSKNNSSFAQQTNIGSNKAEQNYSSAKRIDNEIQEEVEKAAKLVKEVSKQLSKQIPIVPDLKMPVKTTSGADNDSIKDKTYTGDSNIEYFLEKRYHISLPIPVYLTQYGGIIKVNIQVNSQGTVVKADPVADANSNELMLSYAKTAALRTKFNAISTNQLQEGYIKYRFIAQ
jgi:hypothetical protein